MLRAIREIQPSWVVGENVSGLISWNGGLVFHEVQTDLEAEGYEVFPVVLPACAVNAPHRRDRVWFLAYSNVAGKRRNQWEKENETNATINPNNQGRTAGFGEIQKEDGEIPEWNNDAEFGNAGAGIVKNANSSGGKEPKQQQPNLPAKSGRSNAEIAPNPTSKGRKEREPNNGRTDSAENGTGLDDRFERFSSKRIIADTGLQRQTFGQQQAAGIEQCSGWECFPTQPPVCSRNDGISAGLVGITVSKHRNESIKAYGNAIVPQIALMIFKAIESYEKM
jgi:DNA (cytosine-5)-methyltransferase 1